MDVNEVLNQFRDLGLRVDAIEDFGKIIRVPVDWPRPDKGRKKSGWYVVHEIRLDSGEFAYAGAYGNHKSGEPDRRIGVKPQQLSPQERQAYERKRREAAERAREEQAALARQACERANRIWPKLPEQGTSAYLERKGVGGYGVRYARGSIVVPIRRPDFELVGLQWIDPDGKKTFLTGTPKKGHFHLIHEGEPLYRCERMAVCEGYATAATVYKALGIPTAVAFDAGNLTPVAEALQQTFSPTLIIVAGDNDDQTDGNPGLVKARQAAAAVRGVAVVPQEVADGH